MGRQELGTGVYAEDLGRLTYKVKRRWRHVTVGAFRQWRVCPRCAAIVEGNWGQGTHIRYHDEMDELLEKMLHKTLGEPGENGYEWNENPAGSSESGGPDSGPDRGTESAGWAHSGWRRYFK